MRRVILPTLPKSVDLTADREYELGSLVRYVGKLAYPPALDDFTVE